MFTRLHEHLHAIARLASRSLFTLNMYSLRALLWNAQLLGFDVWQPLSGEECEKQVGPFVRGRISVIIPCYNEASTIPYALKSVCSDYSTDQFDIEVVVADGGSAESTKDVASTYAFTLVAGGSSRASSMNAGVNASTGEFLLFLHADTELPAKWASEVLGVLQGQPTSVCAFSFQIKEGIPGKANIEWGTNMRSRDWQLPYGDQALFMTRRTFVRLGRYPDVPFMEDYDLVKRAQRIAPIVISPLSIVTSGRRWVENGSFWNTFKNQLMLIGNAVGVPRPTLGKLYNYASSITAKRKS